MDVQLKTTPSPPSTSSSDIALSPTSSPVPPIADSSYASLSHPDWPNTAAFIQRHPRARAFRDLWVWVPGHEVGRDQEQGAATSGLGGESATAEESQAIDLPKEEKLAVEEEEGGYGDDLIKIPYTVVTVVNVTSYRLALAVFQEPQGQRVMSSDGVSLTRMHQHDLIKADVIEKGLSQASDQKATDVGLDHTEMCTGNMEGSFIPRSNHGPTQRSIGTGQFVPTMFPGG
ncbi:MAG: hypothetical protein Q9217_005227 [Psora testacea]